MGQLSLVAWVLIACVHVAALMVRRPADLAGINFCPGGVQYHRHDRC